MYNVLATSTPYNVQRTTYNVHRTSTLPVHYQYTTSGYQCVEVYYFSGYQATIATSTYWQPLVATSVLKYTTLVATSATSATSTHTHIHTHTQTNTYTRTHVLPVHTGSDSWLPVF